jgi:hypothetical protein
MPLFFHLEFVLQYLTLQNAIYVLLRSSLFGYGGMSGSWPRASPPRTSTVPTTYIPSIGLPPPWCVSRVYPAIFSCRALSPFVFKHQTGDVHTVVLCRMYEPASMYRVPCTACHVPCSMYHGSWTLHVSCFSDFWVRLVPPSSFISRCRPQPPQPKTRATNPTNGERDHVLFEACTGEEIYHGAYIMSDSARYSCRIWRSADWPCTLRSKAWDGVWKVCMYGLIPS